MAKPKIDVWMPIYVGDYLRDTQGLTAEEHGVYFLLLMHYWQKKGEIGSDIKRLSVVARAGFDATKYILESFFTLQNGNYKNKRSDKEIDAACARSESARANILKRWKRENDTPVLPANNGRNTDRDTESIPNAYGSDTLQSSSSSSSSPLSIPSKKDQLEIGAAKRFVKPSIEEVGAYCRERGNRIQPSQFLDHYESNGWRVGKNPMKDWKAAIRTWERNDGGKQNGRSNAIPTPEHILIPDFSCKIRR